MWQPSEQLYTSSPRQTIARCDSISRSRTAMAIQTTVPLKPGFKLKKRIQRPPTDLMAQLAQFAAANVSDIQGRQLTMRSEIHPVTFPGRKIVGPAVTVKARPGDNLMAMKVIELAQPGDVIVISSDGEANLSVWG